MKRILILILSIVVLSCSSLKGQNPFEKFGYHVKVLTMTNGKYNEFFDQDTIQQVGDVLINTNTMKVIGFAEKDTVNQMPEPQLISRWISPDAYAEKYYFLSPYNYAANDPINNIDINGDSIWTTKTNDITTFHMTGKVLNVSGEKLDMNSIVASFMGKMKEAIESIKGFELDIQFEVANSMDDVKESDHLITLVDDVEAGDFIFDFGEGIAPVGGKIAYLQADLGDNLVSSMIHEFGHNMGLEHTSTNNPSDINYMSYGEYRNFFSRRQLNEAVINANPYINISNRGQNYYIPGSNLEKSFWGSSEVKPYIRNITKGQKIPFPMFLFKSYSKLR